MSAEFDVHTMQVAFDERWPLKAPSLEITQQLVDRMVEGGYHRLSVNMRRLNNELFEDQLPVSAGYLNYLKRMVMNHARMLGLTGKRPSAAESRADRILGIRDSDGHATARRVC
ncbi:hypothetical protein [uncultured Desulfovibrio sp.]|uniref:hypothetical protein n=1 Tax=uncultured Desulfovibrio sp. TaxID=167968 RepID=UPI002615D9BC|nr:hypothetical protein [uncultured Desulfovibrio sp.]